MGQNICSDSLQRHKKSIAIFKKLIFMHHVVSLHLQISVILEVRGSSHSSVNNDCSRLDIKETLIQYREVEREKTGPNSLKGFLHMWAVLPTALTNRKLAQCAKMTPLPEKENLFFVVCSVGLNRSGSAWRTEATTTNCAGAFWTGFLVCIHAQKGSHLVLPLRLQILNHWLAYSCRSTKSCWVN